MMRHDDHDLHMPLLQNHSKSVLIPCGAATEPQRRTIRKYSILREDHNVLCSLSTCVEKEFTVPETIITAVVQDLKALMMIAGDGCLKYFYRLKRHTSH